jgi:hypothetical protein
MTLNIVNWLCFGRSGMGPNLYSFRCFWLLASVSGDLATLSLKWITQSAPRHCVSLLASHQKGEAV